jgi:hypothetical protein
MLHPTAFARKSAIVTKLLPLVGPANMAGAINLCSKPGRQPAPHRNKE